MAIKGSLSSYYQGGGDGGESRFAGFSDRLRKLNIQEDEGRKRREAAITQGLNKGRSFEDISKQTGVSLDEVRSFTQRTRPEYGIKKQDIVGDVGRAVGGFGKAVVEDIADVTGRISGGVTRLLPGGQADVQALERQTAQETQDLNNLIRVLRDPKTSAEGKAHIRRVIADRTRLGASDELRQRILEETDPLKAGAAFAEAGLTAATGGISKVATTGGKLAVKELAKRGAAEVAQRGAGLGTRAAVLGAEGATIGAAQDVRYGQAPGTGALVGGAVGAAIPVLGAGFRAARGAVAPQTTRRIDNALTKVDETELSDVAQKQIQSAIQEKGRYKQPVLKRAIDTAKRELLDPLNKFERLDRAYAKATGTSLEKLQAEGRSLPEQVLKARYSGEITKTFLEKKRSTKESVNDVIRKYGEDTPAGREFVNYLNNKRTIEVFDKFKKNIQPNQNMDDLRAATEAYELSNKGVGADLKTLKEHFDEILDYAADNKLISKDDAKFIQNRYEVYAPIERVFPDEQIKPTVQGGIRTNVGRQRVIQELEGGERPLDVSFGAVVNKTNDAIAQSLKNRLDNELLTRFKEGNLSGKLLIDPDVSMAAKEARELHKSLVSKTEGLRKGIGTKAAQLRVDNAYTAPLRKKAIKATRTYLRGSTDDEGALAAVNKMSDKELLETFRFINDETEIDTLRASLIKKGENGQRLIDDLENLKSEYKETTAAKGEAFEESLNLRQDPTTGLNRISGVVDGNKFELELDPDVMVALERLSPSDKRAAFGTIAKIPSDIQKTLLTGPFAPVFQATQLLKNQGIMFTNARRLSPFGARAIGSFFKPSKEFISELRARGAQPELFTQSVNEGVQQAAQIAATGGTNLRGKINLAKNHPVLAAKDFWKSLNTFGAFLGNRQRAQIATGAYHNAINRGFEREEALNIAARSYNEVLGNFNRVSTLAKSAEPIFLYSGATQAGARSLFRAFRDRPVETSIKMTAVATPMAGFAANNLSSQAGQDYYQDMYDNKQAYNLDNYLTYVAPWASKDPTTKKWQGVYRIPIAPDFRPINKSIQEQIFSSTNGEGVNATEVAKGVFNLATGGLLAETGGRTDISPIGVAQSIPALRATFSLAGRDIETGKVIPDEDTEYTSETAKKVGEKFGIPANRVDAILKQGGTAGRVAQGRESATETITQTFVNQFKDPFGSSKGISGRIDTLISDKSKIKKQIDEADEKGDSIKVGELENQYNQKVDEFEQFVLKNPRIRSLSEGQRNLLDNMRF